MGSNVHNECDGGSDDGRESERKDVHVLSNGELFERLQLRRSTEAQSSEWA